MLSANEIQQFHAQWESVMATSVTVPAIPTMVERRLSGRRAILKKEMRTFATNDIKWTQEQLDATIDALIESIMPAASPVPSVQCLVTVGAEDITLATFSNQDIPVVFAGGDSVSADELRDLTVLGSPVPVVELQRAEELTVTTPTTALAKHGKQLHLDSGTVEDSATLAPIVAPILVPPTLGASGANLASPGHELTDTQTLHAAGTHLVSDSDGNSCRSDRLGVALDCQTVTNVDNLIGASGFHKNNDSVIRPITQVQQSTTWSHVASDALFVAGLLWALLCGLWQLGRTVGSVTVELSPALLMVAGTVGAVVLIAALPAWGISGAALALWAWVGA